MRRTKSGIDKVTRTVGRHLKRLKMPFTYDQRGILTVAWKIRGRIFPASITAAGEYLYIYAVLMLREELRDADLEEVYERLLRASHTIPEVAFDLDVMGNIGTGQEIPLKALSFEAFKSELNAIPVAINYFLESVAPECGLKVVGFEEE